jgi:hypothetical protein
MATAHSVALRNSSRMFTSMIRSHAGGLVHWMGVAPLQQDILFGAYDEKCRAERENITPLAESPPALCRIEFNA